MNMRSSRKKYLCIWGLCLVMLCVCGWEKNDDRTSQKQKNVVLDESKEEGVRLDSLGQKFEILEYLFEMPKVEHISEQAAEEIQKWQEEELALFWQEVEKQALVENDKFQEIKSDSEKEITIWWGSGFYHVDYCVFESGGLVSFLKREYQLYALAPHEIYDVSAVIFDRNTGEKITSEQLLNRLIGEEQEKRIYLAQYLIEQLMPDEIELFKDYRDKVVYEMLFLPECYVEDEMLVVIFDTYDIATYPAGDIYVEVPLDKADHLEEEIQDKEVAKERIQNLKKPGVQNRYLVEIQEGEVIRADLDGNGRDEVIYYPIGKEQDRNDNELTILVNGKKVSFPLEEKADKNAIALVDLDEEDGEYELAVRVDDEDSSPATVFFGYYDKEFKEVGRVNFRIDRETTNSGEAEIRGSGFIWGNEDFVEIHKEDIATGKAMIEELKVEGSKLEGSKLDSFYQESLLLEYDFFIPQITCQAAKAAEKIKEWQETEYIENLQGAG